MDFVTHGNPLFLSIHCLMVAARDCKISPFKGQLKGETGQSIIRIDERLTKAEKSGKRACFWNK
jgi:hypothetical protein